MGSSHKPPSRRRNALVDYGRGMHGEAGRLRRFATWVLALVVLGGLFVAMQYPGALRWPG